MGLFDKFLKATTEVIDGTKNAIESIQNDMEQDSKKFSASGYERFDSPSEPLPLVPVQARLHDRNVQFMLSDDFTNHEGYSRSVVALKYNPEHLGVLEYDDEGEITVSLQEGVGDLDEIAECIDEYISTGTVADVEQFEDYPDGKYLFKAKIATSDHIMYFYVLRSDASDPYDYDVLLLFYPSEVQDTNLEKKVMSCFEEAARSLTA